MQALSRKKDIKAFSGFAFEDSNKVKNPPFSFGPSMQLHENFSRQIENSDMQAAELEKVETKLGKWTLPHLHSLLDLLDIPRGAGEEGLKVCM